MQVIFRLISGLIIMDLFASSSFEVRLWRVAYDGNNICLTECFHRRHKYLMVVYKVPTGEEASAICHPLMFICDFCELQTFSSDEFGELSGRSVVKRRKLPGEPHDGEPHHSVHSCRHADRCLPLNHTAMWFESDVIFRAKNHCWVEP